MDYVNSRQFFLLFSIIFRISFDSDVRTMSEHNVTIDTYTTTLIRTHTVQVIFKMYIIIVEYSA